MLTTLRNIISLIILHITNLLEHCQAKPDCKKKRKEKTPLTIAREQAQALKLRKSWEFVQTPRAVNPTDTDTNGR